MFINPHTAIDQGWISGIHDIDVQVQPNAIDFTLDRLFLPITTATFVISEHEKIMRPISEVKTFDDRRALARGERIEFWNLSKSYYDGMSDVYVVLPEGVAAMLIIRSSFNRNGIFLTSGLYDSGFEGHIGFVLHNRSPGKTLVAKGTRIGQVMFVASDTAKMYAGGWNHSEGTHYAEET